MTTIIDDDSVRSDITSIDDGDSPYTTSGEDIILVDTTNGAVTVTLASSDATADPEQTIRIIDDGGNAGTNAITVNTEGAETIDPDGASSKTISVNSAGLEVQSNGTNWRAVGRNQDVEEIITEGLNNTVHFPDPADDCAGIRDAISDASAGDTIYLRNGQYDADRGTDTGINVEVPAGKPLLITGDEGATIKAPNGLTTGTEGIRLMSIFAAGTIVENITLDGNYQNNGTSTSNDGHNLNVKDVNDCTIRGVTSINATGDGLGGTGDNLKYTGCTVKDAFEQCLHLAWGSGLFVEDCYFGSTQNGGCIDTNSFDTEVLEDVEFSNVIVEGGGAEDAAVYIRSGAGTVRDIHGDITVLASNKYGAWISGNQTGADAAPDGIDLDLTIRSADDDGIRIEDVGDVRLSGSVKTDSHGVLIDPNSNTGEIDLSNLKLRAVGLAAASQGVLVAGGSNDMTLRLPKLIREGTGGDLFNGIQLDGLGSGSTTYVVGCTVKGYSNLALTGDSDPDYVYDNRPAIPVDVTTLAAEEGNRAYHDGTGVGEEGMAHHNGSVWYYENGVTESANAETPQGTYASGQIVYFTDSGDGSGTGMYIIDDGGTAQGAV